MTLLDSDTNHQYLLKIYINFKEKTTISDNFFKLIVGLQDRSSCLSKDQSCKFKSVRQTKYGKQTGFLFKINE
jgi:hypothetical protein